MKLTASELMVNLLVMPSDCCVGGNMVRALDWQLACWTWAVPDLCIVSATVSSSV